MSLESIPGLTASLDPDVHKHRSLEEDRGVQKDINAVRKLIGSGAIVEAVGPLAT